MKRRLVAAASAAALCLPSVGCAGQRPPMGQISGLQVSTGKCLVATDPVRKAPDEGTNKGLFDEVAKAVIIEGANYIGKALTEAGKARTLTASGVRNLQAPSSGLPECVQVVRGRFDATGTRPADWSVPSPWPATTAVTLKSRGINAVDTPDFLFEGVIIQSDDGSSYTIRPAAITYNQPIKEKVDEGQVRHLALFFALTGPGVKATADSAPATNIVVGGLSTGDSFKYAEPMASAGSSAYEPIWFSIGQDLKKPISINVVESNTRDEQAFLTFLGKILSTDKVNGEITTGAQQIFIPAVAQQNQAADEVKAITSDATLNTRMATARGALLACASATTDAAVVTASGQAFDGLTKYLEADIAATPKTNAVNVAMIQKVNSQLPPATLKANCQDIYNKLTKPG